MLANFYPSERRQVLHLDIASFAAVLAQVKDSHLRGWPTVVAPRGRPRAGIVSASPEAKREGIVSGMPVYQALLRCRNLRVVSPDEKLWQQATQAVLKIVGQYSPIVESFSLGHVFADLSGTQRLLGHARDLAARLRQDITRQLRLPGFVGLAANKMVSQLAAHTLTTSLSREGLIEVRNGQEAPFLAPLVAVLLPAVRNSNHRQRILADLNIVVVRELASLDYRHLGLAFGRRDAFLMHEQSRGIDRTPVSPPQAISQWQEREIFSEPSNDDGQILAAWSYLTERLQFHLYQRQVACDILHQLQLGVFYVDHVQQQITLDVNSQQDLFQQIQDAYEKNFHRRTRINQIEMAAWLLRNGTARQLSWVTKTDKMCHHRQALQQTLHGIRKRFGFAAITSGSSRIFLNKKPKGSV